ncbi:UNVERIFIED_CONTAM: hypothetical protein GTU68_052601 [Idotea baltica]|nr:hypothetical protein [Idotea baltica]
MTENIPQFGSIIWINFNPIKGHEQSGKRPALVLSNTKYNDVTGMALVAPITSKTKGYAGEIPLPEGLEIKGVILSDQIRNLEWIERPVDISNTILDVAIVKKVLLRLKTICSE